MRRIVLTAVSALALSLPLPMAAQAEPFGLAGAYLAGRQALSQNAYSVAAQYYARAVGLAPSRPDILERATLAHFALGRLDRAVDFANRLERDGHTPSQIAQMVVATDLAQQKEFQAILDRFDTGLTAGPLSTDLLRAWAVLGTGDNDRADVLFDEVAEDRTLRPFAMFHKALARSVAGNASGALDALNDPAVGGLNRTRRAIRLRAELLARTGDVQGARVLLAPFTAGPNPDPAMARLSEALSKGEAIPPSDIASVTDGMAEVFLTLAEALRTEADADFLLLYVRAALHLRPDLAPALVYGAELLEELEQYALAVSTYRKVPESDPIFAEAEIGRATALQRSGQDDLGISVLKTLAEQRPTLPEVHSALGDALRRADRYGEATAAYDAALALADTDAASSWFLYYVRGITYERTDQWPQAEADFRQALAINPGQPQVLNYLGYSLVQKQTKLDEALSMIEQAVAAAPDSGYIVDSLGWVLYRLGRYEDALPHMIRAAELMPIDPIVSDHLGDVLWANGRTREAEFQWMRALSFVGYGTAAEEVEVDRIRRKLEVGLDVVLQEDGAPPLHDEDD